MQLKIGQIVDITARGQQCRAIVEDVLPTAELLQPHPDGTPTLILVAMTQGIDQLALIAYTNAAGKPVSFFALHNSQTGQWLDATGTLLTIADTGYMRGDPTTIT
jgi:hypothetical protein